MKRGILANLNLAVVGAGGSMGKGISLCILQYLYHHVPNYKLTLIDRSSETLDFLKSYIQIRFDDFTFDEKVVFDTDLSSLKDADIVFEAVFEDVRLKTDLISKLNHLCKKEMVVFTNTSAIPIHTLEEKSGMEGRVVGFHFYNPAHKQKLLEIIFSKYTSDSVKRLAKKWGSRLKKEVVIAGDVPGFIGNGYFIREGIFAFEQLKILAENRSVFDGIAVINAVTKELLGRPMGIFEVIGFVKVPVFELICSVMCLDYPKFKEIEKDPSILKATISDSPNSDELNKWLGPVSSGYMEARNYSRPELANSNPGGSLAYLFLDNLKEIAELLLENGAATSLQDVDLVLKLGFRHPYGSESWD